jgi:hypothetical protein
MKQTIIICISFITINTCLNGINVHREDQSGYRIERTDSLPSVLPKNHADLIESKLRLEAVLKFGEHQLPDNLKDWETYRVQLKNEIIKKAGVVIDHKLPLNIKETGTIQMKGYTVKNIAFQTRPGVYATANLYIPDGKGPFPAVINMLGHWPKGKIDSTGPQAVGHSLALNGYVCLTIDPWGSGERTTIHGILGINEKPILNNVHEYSKMNGWDRFALGTSDNNLILRNAPISYLFDNRENVDFFSMGIHLPGFLNWGDVSLAAALSGKNITFINPVTMSGQKVSVTRLKEYKTEFEKLRSSYKQPGNTVFN